jgi:GNAT superfamily N-acetyltransferase
MQRTNEVTGMPMSIRAAELADLDTIARFNQSMAMETEGKSLASVTIRLGVGAVLQDPAKGVYYLAENEDRIIGQMMLTTEWSDWRNAEFWWIQSVFVDPAWRGQKVFSALYRHVEQLGRRHPGCCGLRLYVEQENVHARNVYNKLGMIWTRYDLMETEF